MMLRSDAKSSNKRICQNRGLPLLMANVHELGEVKGPSFERFSCI